MPFLLFTLSCANTVEGREVEAGERLRISRDMGDVVVGWLQITGRDGGPGHL